MQIQIEGLTFAHKGSLEKVFDNVSFSFDTSWRLGFTGLNGKGKTTFLKLLLGIYGFDGEIIARKMEFRYFPSENFQLGHLKNFKEHRVARELHYLNMTLDDISKPISCLSSGQRIKVELVDLFLSQEDSNYSQYLLLDEPTNHLDIPTKILLGKYLTSKKGFMLVSHDREILDNVTTHTLNISNYGIEIIKGNYSTFERDFLNKKKIDKLKKKNIDNEIKKLELSKNQLDEYANISELNKQRILGQTDNRVDKGFVGKKSSKIAKRSKSRQRKLTKEIERNKDLLSKLEIMDTDFNDPGN